MARRRPPGGAARRVGIRHAPPARSPGHGHSDEESHGDNQGSDQQDQPHLVAAAERPPHESVRPTDRAASTSATVSSSRAAAAADSRCAARRSSDWSRHMQILREVDAVADHAAPAVTVPTVGQQPARHPLAVMQDLDRPRVVEDDVAGRHIGERRTDPAPARPFVCRGARGRTHRHTLRGCARQGMRGSSAEGGGCSRGRTHSQSARRYWRWWLIWSRLPMVSP